MKRYELSDRGFYGFEFKDLNGDKCSVQESSLATDHAIWVGCNRGTHVNGPNGEEVCLARMHLNREKVAELIPLLRWFVAYGELPKDPSDCDKIESMEEEIKNLKKRLAEVEAENRRMGIQWSDD
jgi:hypothetical protein